MFDPRRKKLLDQLQIDMLMKDLTLHQSKGLIVYQPLIREKIDTVRSTGWKMQESSGVDMIQIDDMIKDLLLTKGVEVLTTDS